MKGCRERESQLLLFIVLLLLCSVLPASSLDSPHTSIPGYGLTCGNCHWTHASGTPPWASTVNSSDPADDTINNRRCYACHDGSKAGIPAAGIHSSSTTSTRFWSTMGWRTECVTCHDPHQQRQTRAWGSLSYLVSGQAPVSVGAWNTSTGNWTTVTVGGPLSANYTGYYFMPDRNYPLFYEVVEDTTGKTTFKVKGSVNPAYVKAGGYAFVYGKDVREYISYLNPGGATVGGTVKLFRPGGANGPADNANVSTSVCYVCHTQGTHWSIIGDTSHNNLTTCSSCHKHMSGFRALCADCHGGPPVVDSPLPTTGLVWTTPTGSATAGAHATHVNSKGIACSACHYNSVSSGPTHNSGKITIGFYNFGGASQGGSYDGQNTANYDATTTSPATSVSNSGSKTCSNVYCHGASMAPNNGTNITPVWSSGATVPCGSCHGATAANPPLRGSHRTHVMNDIWSHAPNTDPPFNNYIYGRNMACTSCHNNYTASHVNGSVEWLFDTAAYPWTAGATYKGSASGSSSPVPGTYGQCANLYCHSIAQTNTGGQLTGLPGEYKSPTWGSLDSGTCGSCHYADQGHSYWADRGMSAPEINSGSHAKHLENLTATVGGGSNGPSRCGVCHNYVGSDNLSGCASVCHNRNDLHVDHKVDVKFPPTIYGTSALYNGTPAPGDGYSNCSNTYCHSNGTSVSTGTIPANTSPTWGAGTTCNTCHGAPPSYVTGSPKANSHLSHTASTCNKCHAATTSDGSTITGNASHVNKSYDLQAGSGISFSYSYSTAGGTCSIVSCHGSTDAQWGASSSVACMGCHAVSQGNRVAISSQFAANSHHVQWSTVTGTHCYQCHWEANSDGTINRAYHGGAASPNAPVDLVVRGSSTARPLWYTITGPNVSAVQYTAFPQNRSEIAKINTACLGCHNDANKDTDVFGDGKTPRQYAWDSTSVSARYSQWGTANWGKYASVSGAAKKDITKAFSAHGNAQNNYGGGWSSTPNGTGNDGPLTPTRGGAGAASVACFDCHNSHGSTAAGVTTSYPSATVNGGLLKDTTSGKGGYAVNYKPLAGGSVANKNAYNPGGALCFDCHLNANWGTTPWGYNSTYNASQPILGYFDTAFFGLGTFPSQQRFPYKESGHLGGHLGAWSTLSSAPARQINGLCTPCHDPHGVSPTLGSDMQYAVPLLKGTFMTSPYKEDVAPANNGTQSYISGDIGYHIDQNTFGTDILQNVQGVTQSDTQFAGLCLGCHAKTSLTNGTTHDWKSKDRIHESVKGWKTANPTVKHNYTCSKCHTTHNSRLPRLMVSNCLNSDHKGRLRYNAFPVVSGVNVEDHSGSNTYYGGSGSGRIPGIYSGTWEGTHLGTCHENNTGSTTNQSWNTKTPWAPVPIITAGPLAGSFAVAGSNVQATITWSTDTPSTSVVEYGLTNGYGAASSGAAGVLNHSVTITMPAATMNHQTIHFRVKSGTASGETASGDFTFYISMPPAVPALTPEPNALCSASCAIELLFASTDPDGGTIEYLVEVDTNDPPLPTSPNYQSRSWSSSTSWSPVLGTNMKYYWRAKARDQAHTTALDPTSDWSPTNTFALSDGVPPPVPTLSGPANGSVFTTACDTLGYWTTFSFYSEPVTEYRVLVDDDPAFATPNYDSGWALSATWSADISSNFGTATYYWKVGARDPANPGAENWSGSWSFTVYYGGGCPKSSCPFVFAWDGQKYNYVTDLQGAPLGYAAGSSMASWPPYFRPQYVVLDSLKPDAQGKYNIKLREPLPEISYFDEAKLLAVDYPAGYELASSTAEMTYRFRYANPFKLYTLRNPRPPVLAIDKYGADILASVLDMDGNLLPMELFALDNYTFDFGSIDPANAKLLIDGWSVFGSQYSTALPTIQPYIEVVDTAGQWVKIKSFGEPSGDMKRMVIDLSNLFLSSDHRIRLNTGRDSGMAWRIDKISLDDSVPVSVTMNEITADSADLHYRGRAPYVSSTLDHRIAAWDDVIADDVNSYGFGNFTKYGDVITLLNASDDMFAIMRHGDEMGLTFSGPSTPVAPGMQRSFLLKADVYYKTFRVNKYVAPLPFHGMSSYPYDPAVEHYPDDAAHNQYQLEYNTRILP